MAWYCIMDERARYNVDNAIVLQVCDNDIPLLTAIREREKDWPDQNACVVDMNTWEVVA